MNAREAKRDALLTVAKLTESYCDTFDDPHHHALPEADQARIERALIQIANELTRRAGFEPHPLYQWRAGEITEEERDRLSATWIDEEETEE